MSERSGGVARRDFLRALATFAVAGGAALPAGGAVAAGSVGPRRSSAAPGPAASGKSRVVLVRDRDVLRRGGGIRPDVLGRMVDQAAVRLTGAATPAEAWSRLVKPGDTVGIKSNSWRFLPTPPELEQALRERLLGAGVAPERIGIDDRGVLQSPIFRGATALINVRPLRTHHWAGVGSCIKNYIMFSPDPPSWHADACADLAGLWNLPVVKGKTRLNILVVLTPLFHGKGPHDFQERYRWEYHGLILSADPVAADATGLRILEAKRREHFGSEQPFVVSPKHIAVAEKKFHLGVADPARIELIRLGETAGILM